MVGVTVRVEAEKLRVTVPAGKLHRLTFPLAGVPSIDVRTARQCRFRVSQGEGIQ